ncbi:hypothetical protein QN397_15625 [Variovorax sp. RTB1]|nr:hypothetical protein [Variovorax sp. RTB1]MEB0112787.1 hypothetical protein [Variovorax sp. RTB1]
MSDRKSSAGNAQRTRIIAALRLRSHSTINDAHTFLTQVTRGAT